MTKAKAALAGLVAALVLVVAANLGVFGGGGFAADADSPSTVVVTFTPEASVAEMAAFFDGFNAGTMVFDTVDRFGLRPEERTMTITFEPDANIEGFIFIAERSRIVESAVTSSD